MPLTTTLDPGARYALLLASCANPDHGETRAPMPAMIATGTLEEIYRDVRAYRGGLGGGNWARADLYEGGKKIGRMSYNGRIWPPGPWRSGMIPLAEPPEWFNKSP